MIDRFQSRLCATGRSILWLTLLGPFALPPQAEGQTREIAVAGSGDDRAALAGVVRSWDTDQLLAGVRVFLIGTDRFAYTDDDGRFLVGNVRPGDHEVEISYRGRSSKLYRLTLDSGVQTDVSIAIKDGVITVPTIEVEIEGGKAGKMRNFQHRMATEPGYFITRADIERRDARHVADMLRMVPGVHIGTSFGAPTEIAMRGRDCTIEYFIDGMPTPGLDPNNIPAWDIEGIEVYRGPSEIPVQYRMPNSCAAILLWTWDPGTP